MGRLMTSTDRANVIVYSRRIQERMRNLYLFSRFTHTTSPQTEAQAARKMWPKGNANAIINVIPSAFAGAGDGTSKGGGEHLRIPMEDEVYGNPQLGDHLVKGTGQAAEMRYADVYVHRFRKEKLVQLGKKSMQLLGAWGLELAKKAGPQITDWHMRFEASRGIHHAIIRGQSWHILEPVARDGLGVDGKIHPNLYCAGVTSDGTFDSNYPTWSATPATYEAAAAKHVFAVSGGASEHQMSASLLRSLEKQAMRKRLKKVNFGGVQAYVMVLHPDQYQQLLEDAEFVNSLQNWARTDQAKIFTESAEAYYSGFVIFRSGYGQGGGSLIYPHYLADTTGLAYEGTTIDNADKLYFGPVETITTTPYVGEKEPTKTANIDSDTIAQTALRHLRCGMILGAEALSGVMVERPSISKEMDDYENKKSIAIDATWGYGRPDFNKYSAFTEVDGTVTETISGVENTGSVLFVTYSPDGLLAA